MVYISRRDVYIVIYGPYRGSVQHSYAHPILRDVYCDRNYL